MRRPLIGLLPLYLELYDVTSAHLRPTIDTFKDRVTESLRQKGLDVVDVPVCRVEREVKECVEAFEGKGVDAIVTLHLAYSPSLESEAVLSGTRLPVIVLDTTPRYEFGADTPDSEIMFNHGIHGVQDMCNLLLRNKKNYVICAGHLDHSNVLNEVARMAQAAKIRKNLVSAKVGMVGEPFKGMGDFFIPQDELKSRLGIEIVPYDAGKGAERIAQVAQAEIDEDYEGDCGLFDVDPEMDREVYDRSQRVAIGIRKWCEEEELSAFTINFLETEGSPVGLPVMPFLECSRGMANGTGYAGEGDALTAALVGALMSVYGDTTFAEMFCPDWKGNSVFLSHMGEFNLRVAAGKPFLTEKAFPFTSAQNPTVAYSTMRPGKAVFVNLAPTGEGFNLILAQGEMVEVCGENKLSRSVNGWFRPEIALPEFLKRFSMSGGTHHGAVVYGADMEVLRAFGQFMDFNVIEIG